MDFAIRNEQELEAHVLNYTNWIIWFIKLDPIVLSGPMTVRDAARLRRGDSPPLKRCLDGGEA
jgi:hypothetical protein